MTTQTTQTAQMTPQAAMLQIISGFWISRAVYVLAKLGIPDLLAERPHSVEELAQLTKTHAPSLFRVLRALASVGVIAETLLGPAWIGYGLGTSARGLMVGIGRLWM